MSDYEQNDKTGKRGGSMGEGRGEGREGRGEGRMKRVGRIPLDAEINYKNPQFLKQFISDRGKIMPRRLSGANPKQQRALAVAIKRARSIALLPFAAE